MLRQYASRRIDLLSFNAWLVEAEYDDAFSRAERDVLASIRLVAIDAAEAQCPEEAVVSAVSTLIGAAGAAPSRRQPA